MRKPVILAATVVFVSLMAFPQGAFADDESEQADSWELIFGNEYEDQEEFFLIMPEKPRDPNKPATPEGDHEHKHKTLNDHYGEVEQVGVPPILIRPDVRPESDVFELPILTQSIVPEPEISSLGEIEDLTSNSATTEEIQELIAIKLGVTLPGGNEEIALLPSEVTPSTSVPIQIREVSLTTKTPADEFLDVAMLFGAGLGAVAVGLVGVTGVSALKLRREAKQR
jgi:preprotein translocase subunit Sss1